MQIFDNVQKTLANPVVQQGLRLLAPEISIMTGVIGGLIGAFKTKQDHTAAEVLNLMDARLAQLLELISKEKNSLLRKEYEIRLHEILGILTSWQKRG